ncbi:MAG: hypothetical protein CMJ49_11440, partial [Planctomycetaceae bacterium]|nr:hypothetical protein [Planctomycetaceae bacterium]
MFPPAAKVRALAIVFGLALILPAGVRAAKPDALTAVIRNAPAHGIVLEQLPPTGAWKNVSDLRAMLDDTEIPAQLIRLEDSVWLAMKLPGPGDFTISLTPTASESFKPVRGPATFANRWYAVAHDPARQAGLPSSFRFPPDAKPFDTFNWNDRVYHKQLGSFHLRNDPRPRLTVVSDGPLCRVVQTRARYLAHGGRKHRARPRAVYTWFYFHDLPLLQVHSRFQQQRSFQWDELHFLELNYPDARFDRWAGAAPGSGPRPGPSDAGQFKADQTSRRFTDWAMLKDENGAIAMLRAGHMLIYDGRGGYGTYLHAHANKAWAGSNQTHRDTSAWLWIGPSDQPERDVAAALDHLPAGADVRVYPTDLLMKLSTAHNDPSITARQRVLAQSRLEAGALDDARLLLQGAEPDTWSTLRADQLALTVRPAPDGLAGFHLVDLEHARELTAENPPPLFTVTLRNVKSGQLRQLQSHAGWDRFNITSNADRLTLNWINRGQHGLRIEAEASAHPIHARITWAFNVAHDDPEWGVWRVVFPRLALRPFAPEVHALIPQASGVVKENVFRAPMNFRGTYPDLWTTMPFLAAYAADGTAGFYHAFHDPAAWVRELSASSDPNALTLAFDTPAPNMGQPGIGFHPAGQAVWQLFRGDWFDAANIYHRWVTNEAPWWPRLHPKHQRIDTPQWMRQVPLWGMLRGEPLHAVPAGQHFARTMDLPVAFHWYHWHQIPFDNDYPHYFPPREGFADAVAQLQDSAGPIMPYINGRLWDTRDDGTQDRHFTLHARPAAVRQMDGSVKTESYNSTEIDGSNVKLAVMCPATDLWRNRVKQIVLRLTNEFGVKAVYIDQVAAAAPALCFDKTHGHPLGGGGWWVDAYRRMLTDIRQQLPPDAILTTECNADPYLDLFDGYLTWHWQHDGQVPAFSAVYGGAIQLFGRAYRAGPTRDLALRMKAAQQLVFGEQIGWIDVNIVNEPQNAAFLKQIAHLRHRLSDYFHVGRMARPPTADDPMPQVTADWQWDGIWPVTTSALLAGAWKHNHDNR